MFHAIKCASKTILKITIQLKHDTHLIVRLISKKLQATFFLDHNNLKIFIA